MHSHKRKYFFFVREFLYLGRNDFPTEEEQFQAYKQAVQTMAGKKVIIRTLDIGADKQVEYFNLGKEENPALGYRAIRICLKQPEIFKAQLRALFRAAVYGNLSVMYPMITSTWEIISSKIEKFTSEKSDSAGIIFHHIAKVTNSADICIDVDLTAIRCNIFFPFNSSRSFCFSASSCYFFFRFPSCTSSSGSKIT